MRKNFTNEQLMELTKISAVEQPGKVVNLSCFGKKAAINTRINRIEKILPNVESLVILGEDKKFSPLTNEQKVDMVMKIFNHFWLKHLNYTKNHFEFIGGLQDDFFDEDSCSRLKNYAGIFFKNRILNDVVERNHLKYRFETEDELRRIGQMETDFNASLDKKIKQVSSNFVKHKKDQKNKQVSLLQELVANNLAWQDAHTVGESGTSPEITFTFN